MRLDIRHGWEAGAQAPADVAEYARVGNEAEARMAPVVAAVLNKRGIQDARQGGRVEFRNSYVSHLPLDGPPDNLVAALVDRAETLAFDLSSDDVLDGGPRLRLARTSLGWDACVSLPVRSKGWRG